MRREAPEPPPGLTAADPREWMRMWARVIGPASLKNVGAWCAHFADYRTGAEIRPGIPLLMKVCGGMGNKTVGDSLKQMRDWGVLWRYAEASKNGVKGNSDIHRLTFPDDISAIPMLGPDWGEPVENLLTTCRHDTWSALDHLFPRQVPPPNHLSSRQPTLTKYNPYGVVLPIPNSRGSRSGGSAGSAYASRPKSRIEMDVLNYARCYHCLIDGHWRDDCPLLVPAENQAEHLNRIDEIRDRFLYGNLPPHDRYRMIETENGLWRKRQKEMAK